MARKKYPSPKAALTAAMSHLNDEWARSPMKRFRQTQSMTVQDCAQSMLEGYTGTDNEGGAMKYRANGDYPKIKLAAFKKEAARQIKDVYKRWSPAGGKKSVTVIKKGYNGNHITITSMDQSVLANEFRGLGIIYVNKRLKQAGKAELGGEVKELARREAATEAGKSAKEGGLTPKQVKMDPADRLANMGGVGETFSFRSGFNEAHEGASTVGGARMVAAEQWLKLSRYSEYTTSGEFKTLKARFPDFGLFFETTGMTAGKAKGTVNTSNTKIALKENMRIMSTVSPSSSNFSGSELNDWGRGTGDKRETISKLLGESLDRWSETVDWTSMKGSNSIREQAIQVATMVALAGVSKGKVSKRSSKPKSVPKRPAKKENIKAVGAAAAVRSTGRKNKESGEKKTASRKSGSNQNVSPFSYMAMINKKLPQTIRKNMGGSALQNRSGRFANSVTIQDVNKTKQGHPSFGYTYAKNPYQVFEVGTGSAPWATPDRDPRKLIDRSIREVAAELAIGRFYTRRL